MLEDRFLNVYAKEIRSRARYARRSWDEAQRCLGDSPQVEDFWYHMNSFLNSAIAVANLVWPSNNNSKVKRRASQIRSVVGAADEAPAGLRDVRNGFEHFDELLDKWREKSTARNFIDQNLGARRDLRMIGFADEDVARNFDPEISELAVYGVVMNAGAAMREIDALVAQMPRGLGAY